ncbi:MAG: hypothetical protein ABTQ25_03690 [Nitrosomonas ureae]
MDFTVFFTVLSGVITFVIGQLIVKLLLDPVQDMKKTIGQVSHTLVERAYVLANPGVPTKEKMDDTSDSLRMLSSQLHAHLYLIPSYDKTFKVFHLPSKEKLLVASTALIGLSNSVFRAEVKVYEANAKRVEQVCDSLGIFLTEGSRWPEDLK